MPEEKVTGYETIARGSTGRGRLGGQQEFERAEGRGWLLTKIRGRVRNGLRRTGSKAVGGGVEVVPRVEEAKSNLVPGPRKSKRKKLNNSVEENRYVTKD
jgi:hypothetical protein